ncbi:MAG: molybdopterin-binding protein, partial [Lachnospiraceae bacterium]|nr:molybdopterin-binding protein [Lachnospiraceae bacterium]
MKQVKTTEAIGHILCHDMTQIIPGVSKGPRFRKGHVVKEEDIPVLLSMGKEHLYVWEKKEGMLHEDEAAQILYSLCKNPNMTPSEPKEGKIDLYAATDGLLKIEEERLVKVNSLGEMMIATLPNFIPVKKGEKIAGTRVI